MFTAQEQLLQKHLPGKCYWNEDTKTLEFSRPSRLSLAPEFTFTSSQTKVRQANKEVEKHVTLEDVKHVALRYLTEDERCSMTAFFKEERVQQTDAFLVSLLHYLSCILKRHLLEKRHQSLMARPDIIENTNQRKLDEMNIKIEAALKHLGYKYCNLLLEDGISTQSHKAKRNFRSGMTSSRRNHRLYESLCSFCIHVGWVTFCRQELEVIQAEVYRLLRSNIFNPTPKEKNASSGPSKTSTATHPENRKVSAKRPGINSMLNQRSPMLIAVLPTPKEKSPYLFQKHVVNPADSSETRDTSSLLDTSADEISPRIGIIGKPMTNFHHDTLSPYGSDKGEEAEELRDEDTTPSTSQHTASIYSRNLSPHHSNFRQQNVVSRVSTEATFLDSDHR